MKRLLAPFTVVLFLLGALPAGANVTSSPPQQKAFYWTYATPKPVPEPKCVKDWFWQTQDCTARDVHRKIGGITNGAVLLAEYKLFVNVVLAACASTLKAGKKCAALENVKKGTAHSDSALFVQTLLADSNIDGVVQRGAITDKCLPAMKIILQRAVSSFKLRSDGLQSLDIFTGIVGAALSAAEVGVQPTIGLARVVALEQLVKTAVLTDKSGNDILKTLGKRFASSSAIFSMHTEIKSAAIPKCL